MDCVFDNGANCSALICKECAGCTFFKTREQLLAGRKAAENRIINDLPDDVFAHIRTKYPRSDVR